MTALVELGWDEGFEAAFREFRRELPVKERDLAAPARVVATSSNSVRVSGAQGEHEVRLSGGFRHRHGSPPAIGDWVVLAHEKGTAQGKTRLLGVLPRRTVFSRALGAEQAGRHPNAVRRQIIAANVDTVLILTTPDADFDPERLGRYVQAVRASGAQPVLVLNKTDLQEDVGYWLRQLGTLGDLEIYPISAATGQGLERLRPLFQEGVTVALIGSSGMGKSTLVNALLGHDAAQTGEVSAADGQGRHTTTSRTLYRVPGGGLLIDNPGLRDISVWATDGAAIDDLEELATHCRFSRCTHGSEPGCTLREAVEAGELDEARLDAFRQNREQQRRR